MTFVATDTVGVVSIHWSWLGPICESRIPQINKGQSGSKIEWTLMCLKQQSATPSIRNGTARYFCSASVQFIQLCETETTMKQSKAMAKFQGRAFAAFRGNGPCQFNSFVFFLPPLYSQGQMGSRTHVVVKKLETVVLWCTCIVLCMFHFSFLDFILSSGAKLYSSIVAPHSHGLVGTQRLPRVGKSWKCPRVVLTSSSSVNQPSPVRVVGCACKKRKLFTLNFI